MRRSLNKSRWALGIIVVYAFLGIFNALIANDQPLIAQKKGEWIFPAFEDLLFDWGLKSHGTIEQESRDFEFAFFPIIPYKANTLDAAHAGFIRPADGVEHGHYLGTDQLGRDVAAGVIRGCYSSFRIGLLATLFCALLGISLGLLMGYYGNKGIPLNVWQVALLGFWMFFSIYFIFYPPISRGVSFIVSIFFWITLVVGGFYLLQNFSKSRFYLPLDGILTRIIALRRSIPTLILLLVLFPLFTRPHINNVILVILILGWTGFARHARAETLSVKERDFVTASRIMGAGHFSILIKHILPNIMPTLLVLAAMNFAGNVLLESTLSFLGMGIPPEEVSWGSLLSEGRKNASAWWLVIFPGLALFILVFTINKLTDQYLEKDS